MLTFNFILGYQGSSYSETSCNSFFFFDEEREHRLPTFQQNAVNRIRNETDRRGKFTVKIIFFMRSIFSTDLGQPFHRFTVSFILQ